MALNINNISIVHWFPNAEKHKCGYCKSDNGSISYGMWADTMTVRDYQNLIDRGWRRSGRYCYKPIMNEICCPQYTIRCDALNFKMSKSHKKIAKKFNKFLCDGVLNKSVQPSETECDTPDPIFFFQERPSVGLDYKNLDVKLNDVASISNSDNVPSCSSNVESNISDQMLPESASKKVKVVYENMSIVSKCIKKGLGADPSKLPSKKAKLLRLERKQQKMTEKGVNFVKPNVDNEGKSLEQFLYDIPENCKHKLKMKLQRMSREHETFDATFKLFAKYQMFVHGDAESDCDANQFVEFLVETPLKAEKWENNEELGYGSFHQQYWIDDKLVAVGVVDILPSCVSSVYFFYDPDYRCLTLGTYGSLREIDFVRQLHQSTPSIKHYYMGFYIHTCPKMRYKGKLVPSELLCPETYKWSPITDCIPKLEVNKFSRFSDDPRDVDEQSCTADDLDRIKIFMFEGYVYFRSYKHRNAERKVYQNIGKLIGKKCIDTLLFVNQRQ